MVRYVLHTFTEPKPTEQTWIYAYVGFSLDYLPEVRKLIHKNKGSQGLLYTLEDSVLETYPESAGLLLKFKINRTPDYSIKDCVDFLVDDLNSIVGRFFTLPQPPRRTRTRPQVGLPGFLLGFSDKSPK